VKNVARKFVSFMLMVLVGIMGCSVGASVGLSMRGEVTVKVSDIEYPEVEEAHVFDDKDVDKAIQLFYTEWSNEFEHNEALKTALENVRVEFAQEKMHVKGGFRMDGTPFPPEGLPCWGLTRSVDHVQVWIREPPYKIGKTSLVHELIHVALKVTKKTYDADHLGNKYKAWTKKHTKFIKALNAKLLLQSL